MSWNLIGYISIPVAVANSRGARKVLGANNVLLPANHFKPSNFEVLGCFRMYRQIRWRDKGISPFSIHLNGQVNKTTCSWVDEPIWSRSEVPGNLIPRRYDNFLWECKYGGVKCRPQEMTNQWNESGGYEENSAAKEKHDVIATSLRV